MDWPCIAKQFVSPLQISYGHASLSVRQNGQFENPKLVFEALWGLVHLYLYCATRPVFDAGLCPLLAGCLPIICQESQDRIQGMVTGFDSHFCVWVRSSLIEIGQIWMNLEKFHCLVFSDSLWHYFWLPHALVLLVFSFKTLLWRQLFIL